MTQEVLNSKGEVIKLNALEQKKADVMQQYVNSLGFEIPITTLTAIMKKVVEQKFYQIKPSDYVPVAVGNGAWSSNILTYTSFSSAGAFETGNLNTGTNSKLAEADTAISSLTNPIVNWGKTIGWNLMELQIAAKSGSWDLVTSKEKARKTDWDLGIQKVAFLGSTTIPSVLGLLTQSVTSNTAIITKALNSMTATELNAVMGTIYQAYRVNCVYTAKPTHFVIPESDYNGLANQMSETYPVLTKIQAITQMFKDMTQNPNFKVLPLSYANQANNTAVINKNRYALYNYDEDSIRMDLPVDYTNTMANSSDGFSFRNVGYGQYAGALAYRPLEMLYFDWNI